MRGPNRTGYACLFGRDSLAQVDTLFTGPNDFLGQTSIRLELRTLLAPVRGSRKDTTPVGRLVGTTDGWRTNRVIREYAAEYINETESLDISGWAAGKRDVRFAWAPCAPGASRIRYWCIDDVIPRASPSPTYDIDLVQFLYPPRGIVLAPGDTLPPTALIMNRGATAMDVAVTLVMAGRGPVAGSYEQVKYGAKRLVSLPPWWLTDHDWRGEQIDMLPQGWHGMVAQIREVEGDGHFAVSNEDRLDENPENDTASCEFLIASDTWQELPGSNPIGQAHADTRAARTRGMKPLLVPLASPWERDTRMVGPSPSPSLGGRDWLAVPSYYPWFWVDPGIAKKHWDAIAVRDTLVFCLTGDGAPLLKLNLRRWRWTETQPPGPAYRRWRLKADFASGLCWDGSRHVFVIGNQAIYCYDVDGDSWVTVIGRRDDPLRLLRPCPDGSNAVLHYGSEIVAMMADGSLMLYDIPGDMWAEVPAIPGARAVSICRIAADDDCGMFYMLTDVRGRRDSSFIGYNAIGDSWVHNLAQPPWRTDDVILGPGAQLVRVGRYLLAWNGVDDRIWMYNLPPPPRRGSYGIP